MTSCWLQRQKKQFGRAAYLRITTHNLSGRLLLPLPLLPLSSVPTEPVTASQAEVYTSAAAPASFCVLWA